MNWYATSNGKGNILTAQAAPGAAREDSAQEAAIQAAVIEFFQTMDENLLPTYYRSVAAALMGATNVLASRMSAAVRAGSLHMSQQEVQAAAFRIMARSSMELAKTRGKDITNTMKTAPDVKNWMTQWQSQLYNKTVEAAGVAKQETSSRGTATTSVPGTGAPGASSSQMTAPGSSGNIGSGQTSISRI